MPVNPQGDVTSAPLRPENGYLTVPRTAPEPDLIADYESNDQGWIDRLNRVRASL